MNPGGPGGSGIETVHYLVDELPENVKARFDIVGFDPRGVGASTAVDCVDDKDAEADLDPTPDTPTEVSKLHRPPRPVLASVRAGSGRSAALRRHDERGP